MDSYVRSISGSRAWVSTWIGHVVRDQVLLDDLPDEVEVGLARRRETDLDLLVAQAYEQVEHAPLAGRRHRVDQRLVAVAEVDRAPQRRLLDPLRRPGAVGQVDRGERLVAPQRHAGRRLDRRLVVEGHGGRAPSERAGGGQPAVNPAAGSRPLQGPAAAEKEQAPLARHGHTLPGAAGWCSQPHTRRGEILPRPPPGNWARVRTSGGCRGPGFRHRGREESSSSHLRGSAEICR